MDLFFFKFFFPFCLPGPCSGAPWCPVRPALRRVLWGDADAGGCAYLHGIRHPDRLRLPAGLSAPLEAREVPHRPRERGAAGEKRLNAQIKALSCGVMVNCWPRSGRYALIDLRALISHVEQEGALQRRAAGTVLFWISLVATDGKQSWSLKRHCGPIEIINIENYSLNFSF